MNVKLNSFYHKSITFPGSTSSDYTPEEVLKMVAENLHLKKPGDKPGTWLVPLDGKGFFTPTIPVTPGLRVETRYVARREGEEKFMEHYAPGVIHSHAPSAQAILYEVETLQADHDREVDAAEAKGESGPPSSAFYQEGDHEFEVVIVKAPADEPGGLSMMVRNQMGLTGGTPCVYTTEEWCKAVYFALKHVKGEA
jgi:hypothetical protein